MRKKYLTFSCCFQGPRESGKRQRRLTPVAATAPMSRHYVLRWYSAEGNELHHYFALCKQWTTTSTCHSSKNGPNDNDDDDNDDDDDDN